MDILDETRIDEAVYLLKEALKLPEEFNSKAVKLAEEMDSSPFHFVVSPIWKTLDSIASKDDK